MEDKIEVGEFVRTDEGNIFEFGGHFKSGNIDSMTDKDGILYGNQKKCCKKHSKNIIDLIEEGDYVNGEPVETIFYCDDEFEITTTTEYLTNIEDIKSLVTKEQFDSIKYEVVKC